MKKQAFFGLMLWLALGGQAAAGLGVEPLDIATSQGVRHFTVEVARSPKEQELGLMGRDMLPADRGMLFMMVDDRVIHMWMKNTLLPLDMLFIDRHGVVINIAPNAKPGSLDVIASEGPARATLELPGGTSEALKLRRGDKVISKEFAP